MTFGKRAPVDTGPNPGVIAIVIIAIVFAVGYFLVNKTPKQQAAAQTPPAAVVDTTTKP